MAVTMGDVAKDAGVSPRTVSNVVNNIPSVNRELREKVLKSIEKLGYIPDESARRLRWRRKQENAAKPRTHNIGCILFLRSFNKFSDPYFSKILEGIDAEASKQSYHLLFVYLARELEANPALMGKIDTESIDGTVMIGTGTGSERDIFNKITGKVNSVVCINALSMEQFDSIDVDKVQAGYKAVKYLNELGHKRIGFIGDISSLETNERFNGYERGIKELALQYDKNIIEGEAFTYGVEDGFRRMKNILERANPLPTAIVAGSDLTAIGVMEAVKSKGLKVPDDISVIGFDDIEEAKRSFPPLTTLRVDKEGLGSLGVTRLIERISNPGLQTAKIMIPAELVVRESCKKL